jgi:hypothetical protein
VFTIFYSFLNFINYFYANKAIEFIIRNKIYIIGIIILTILGIIIFKNSISKSYFNENNFINLALIGQVINSIILLYFILSIIIIPIKPEITILMIALFHIIVSQLYIFILFQDLVIIPILINILIITTITTISFLISSIIPILYTKKAIMLYNKNNINNICEKIDYIIPIKILIKIIKIKKKINKSNDLLSKEKDI